MVSPEGILAPPMLRRTLPALLFAVAVLSASGPWASAEATGAVAASFLTRLGISAEAALVLHVVARKAGHVAAYAVFAALVWRALPSDRSRVARAVVALSAALVLSALDEALQALTPARGGRLSDVLLDVLGASLGVALCARGFRRSRAGAERAST